MGSVAARREELVIQNTVLVSLFVHAVALILLSGVVSLPQQPPAPQPLRVQFMAAQVSQPQAQAPQQAAPPPEPVKTQASAAPYEAPQTEAPKPTPVQQTQKPTVSQQAKNPDVAAKKTVPAPTPPKEQAAAKPRPPTLDKTPDKAVAVRNDDPQAKTVDSLDDFLQTLEFIDDLAQKPAATTVAADTAAPSREVDLSAKLTSADQALVGQIKQHIERQWLVPPGVQGLADLVIVVRVLTSPDGQVRSVTLEQSSGQPFFDNSLLRAIRKASPLPIPLEKHELFAEVILSFGAL